MSLVPNPIASIQLGVGSRTQSTDQVANGLAAAESTPLRGEGALPAARLARSASRGKQPDCRSGPAGLDAHIRSRHEFHVDSLPRLLVGIGIALVLVGGLLWLAQGLPASVRPFRLPGDIRVERDDFRFYFPITTMVLLSLVLTLVSQVMRWWRG